MAGREKVCNSCNKPLPLTAFHRRKRGFQSICKNCKRDVDKRTYAKNKPQLMRYKAARHRRLVEWHHELKSGKPCAHCGGVFHPAAMQWDHREGMPKLGDVATLLNSASIQRVLAEISKCDLVCANCHAIRTHAARTRARTSRSR